MRIAGLLKNDMVDGSGFSVSLWTQGCPFHCEGCHNPETWDFKGGTEVNKYHLVDEILKAISANGIQRNFSVLGGEPLCSQNIYDVADIIKEVRQNYPNIKIFVWTGFQLENLLAQKDPVVNQILQNIDVLIDGQFEIDKRDVTLWLRGSANQRVIDVKKTLLDGEICELI
jgi:anaerobic ribonucleoside-triphosphate reductase activating protein